MPTSDEKKVRVNGKEQKPLKKTELPPDVDWQAIARKKQKAPPVTEGAE